MAKKSDRKSDKTKVTDLLAKRRAIEKKVGSALARVVGSPAKAIAGGIVTVNATDDVAAQMVKNGVVYTVALNLVALPFAENGFYRLRLTAGQTNGLQWAVFQSKDAWAYQMNLIVNGMVMVLDRASSAQAPPVALPVVKQLQIQVA